MSEAAPADTGSSSNPLKLLPPIQPSLANALPHYLPLAVFPLLYLALIYGSWWLIPPFLFLSIAGLSDRILGQDGKKMDPANTPLKKLFWHNLPVWGWGVLWPVTLIFGMWQILYVNAFVWWQDVILVILLTMAAQAVFVVGHELIHRRTQWERLLAEFLFASSSYPQYATEHIHVHHAHVGTPIDVGSAPKGESFWRYFPKEVKSNLVNSWQATRRRQARRNQSMWHYSNPFWRYGLGVLFWYGVLVWMGGLWAIPVYLLLSLGCVFSMKLSNYFQHYGLRRVRLPNGRWEKVMPRHSWSADWKFSNWLFFNMQRHADHHEVESRHYPLLQPTAPSESPELPGTYAAMMNLVLRPKKWFAKMDPLVDQWRTHYYPEIEDWTPYDSPISNAKPESFEDIVEVFSLSPRLTSWIKKHPVLLDNLQIREFTDLDLPKGFGPDEESESTARKGLTRLYWTYEMNLETLKGFIGELPMADSKEAVEIVRNWANDKAFQVHMHLLRENLTPIEATIALANIAEASIDAVLSAVVSDYIDRVAVMDTDGFAVVALGDLAIKSVYPGCHVEIAFIFGDRESRDAKRLINRAQKRLTEWLTDNLIFTRNSQPLLTIQDLTLGELSLRLSPERLGQVRCFFECDNALIRREFEKSHHLLRSEIKPTDELIRDLLNKPSEVENTTLENFRYVPGGMNHLDDVARYLQLSGSIETVKEVAPKASITLETNSRSQSLSSTSNFWHSLNASLGFLLDQDSEIDQAGDRVKALLASLCECEDFATLEIKIGETAQITANEIEKLVAES